MEQLIDWMRQYISMGGDLFVRVAAALKIPIGTVTSRLSRGRELLRSELAEFARRYGIKQKGGG